MKVLRNRRPGRLAKGLAVTMVTLIGFIEAEMVKSFITSPEYRARFGLP